MNLKYFPAVDLATEKKLVNMGRVNWKEITDYLLQKNNAVPRWAWLQKRSWLEKKLA